MFPPARWWLSGRVRGPWRLQSWGRAAWWLRVGGEEDTSNPEEYGRDPWRRGGEGVGRRRCGDSERRQNSLALIRGCLSAQETGTNAGLTRGQKGGRSC